MEKGAKTKARNRVGPKQRGKAAHRPGVEEKRGCQEEVEEGAD